MKCPLTGLNTYCTDHCRDCARDALQELKEGATLTERELELLRQYNLMEA